MNSIFFDDINEDSNTDSSASAICFSPSIDF